MMSGASKAYNIESFSSESDGKIDGNMPGVGARKCPFPALPFFGSETPWTGQKPLSQVRTLLTVRGQTIDEAGGFSV